jgi:hypothetical protein
MSKTGFAQTIQYLSITQRRDFAGRGRGADWRVAAELRGCKTNWPAILLFSVDCEDVRGIRGDFCETNPNHAGLGCLDLDFLCSGRRSGHHFAMQPHAFNMEFDGLGKEEDRTWVGDQGESWAWSSIPRRHPVNIAAGRQRWRHSGRLKRIGASGHA